MPNVGGKSVGTTGFGLMGLTSHGKQVPYEKAFETMKAALNSGAVFWNGGEFYGTAEANSLHLLNAYFTKYPEDADKVVLSVKGAFDHENMRPQGSKEGIRRSVEECLRVLDGKKKLDIFECARVDPDVPIEESIGYIAEYVKAGKIGGIGVSEIGPKSIRRAAKVHPIAAVEVEFSLFCTDIKTNDVAKVCEELGILIVAYSPLGKGFLTGAIKSPDDVTGFLKMLPRFQPDVFHKNLELVSALQKIAAKKQCTPAQLAISWVKSQGRLPGMPEIVPIPGATTVARVEENSKDVSLSEEELKEIDSVLDTIPITGGRYPGGLANLNWG